MKLKTISVEQLALATAQILNEARKRPIVGAALRESRQSLYGN